MPCLVLNEEANTQHRAQVGTFIPHTRSAGSPPHAMSCLLSRSERFQNDRGTAFPSETRRSVPLPAALALLILLVSTEQ